MTMSYVIHHRSKQEIDGMIRDMEAWAKKSLRTSKQRRAFFIKMGLYDKQGRLTKRYGGDGE